MLNKQLYKHVPFIGVSVALLAMLILSGIACDAGTETVTEAEIETATEARTETTAATEAQTTATTGDGTETTGMVTGGHTPSMYNGLISLEETILMSDVIAVVNLKAVDRGVDVWKFDDDIVYSKTLEYTFEVDEYLKGSGDDQIVGIVFDKSQVYNTALDANLGKEPDPDRKEHWDNRKAVIFLRDDGKDPRLNWKADRYYLGLASDMLGETYSIANHYYRPWLPAVSSEPGEQRFLLQPDLGESSAQTIPLDNLRALVSALDQEIAGRTDEYQDCILYKYRWQRESRYWKETLDQWPYYYYRSDSTVGSGMPQGTKVFTDGQAPIAAHNRLTKPIPEGGKDEYVLAGRDPEYFTGEWPGEIFLARPLPQGEYRVYHAHLPYEWHMCGGTVPEDQMGKQELYVNVTAPVGTLHEAFFDPVEDGKAVVADNTVGVLEPATFTDANGASATITRIAWEAEAGGVGTVKLTLSPHNSIAGHTVDFIALDGSVSLSLAADEAQVDATNGTLTWKVESQPWQSGEKLMLRISAPVS